VNSVPTASRPEGIFADAAHIFVANSGSNLISIYHTEDASPAKSLEVPPGPVQFAEDHNGDLWIVCTGNFSGPSALLCLDRNSLTIEKQINIPEGITLNGKIAIDGSGTLLYIMSEQWSEDFSYTINTIFRHPAGNSNFGYDGFLSRKNIYGLGVDPVGGGIFLADAAAFLSGGQVFVYNENGALLDSVGVDRGPRDFVFVGIE
jgi:hypothetical protein